MRTLIAIAILPIAASCSMASSNAATKSHPAWMTGRWAWVDPTESIQPGDCPHSEFYRRNGHMTDGELGEVYRWWIEGDHLVRVLIKPMEGEPPSEVGRIFRQRFTRTRAGELVFRGDDWAQKMVRCGDD